MTQIANLLLLAPEVPGAAVNHTLSGTESTREPESHPPQVLISWLTGKRRGVSGHICRYQEDSAPGSQEPLS